MIIGPPADCQPSTAPVSNSAPNVNHQPYVMPNLQPNVQPNMQPNVQPNMQPNTQPNMQPNMQPYVNRLPYWGTWVDPRIIHEPGCPYYRELPVNMNNQG